MAAESGIEAGENPSALVLGFALARDGRDVRAIAVGAARAIGPAHLLPILHALLVCLELAVNVYEVHGCLPKAALLQQRTYCVSSG